MQKYIYNLEEGELKAGWKSLKHLKGNPCSVMREISEVPASILQLQPSQAWYRSEHFKAPAQHPPTPLSPTIKLPKPPLEWISTNKFHSKETNWSSCALSCSAGSPLGCLGRQTAGTEQLIPHPFMSWQLPPLSGLKTVCPGIPGPLISDQIISISFPPC